MKVLQVNNFHFLSSGADRVYFDTAGMLQENGHEVCFFSTRDENNIACSEEKYFIDNFSFVNAPKWKQALSVGRFIYSVEAREKMDALIKDLKPDLAHLHIFFGRLTNSILPVLKKHKIPTVMSLHEYKLLCPVYSFTNAKGEVCEKCATGNYFPCVINRCNRNNLSYSAIAALESYLRDRFFSYESNVDQFICVSNFVKEKVLQYRPFIANKLNQINNCVDISQFALSENKKNYCLYFGRLSREKGLLTLLQAWKNISETELWIAGEGEIKPLIGQCIADNNLSNVKLIGFKKGEDLRKIVGEARYVIIPSEWYEPCAMVAIESLATGTPVIASAIGGLPEKIKEGKTGFLCEQNNVASLQMAIARALSANAEQYKDMQHQCRKMVSEHYNRKNYYSSLLSVYQKALQSK